MGRRVTLEQRFWDKVNPLDRLDPDGCWRWEACKQKYGYGLLGVNGKSSLAHRIAYELAYGVAPGDAFVCHTCDNPACVNPAHLFLGSHQDNMEDMTKKGRAGQSRKTHCPHGHAYTPENTTWWNRTYPHKDKGSVSCKVRVCRVCLHLREHTPQRLLQRKATCNTENYRKRSLKRNPCAQQKGTARTECRNGHDLTDPSSYYAHSSPLKRVCKICARERARKQKK